MDFGKVPDQAELYFVDLYFAIPTLQLVCQLHLLNVALCSKQCCTDADLFALLEVPLSLDASYVEKWV